MTGTEPKPLWNLKHFARHQAGSKIQTSSIMHNMLAITTTFHITVSGPKTALNRKLQKHNNVQYCSLIPLHDKLNTRDSIYLVVRPIDISNGEYLQGTSLTRLRQLLVVLMDFHPIWTQGAHRDNCKINKCINKRGGNPTIRDDFNP